MCELVQTVRHQTKGNTHRLICHAALEARLNLFPGVASVHEPLKTDRNDYRKYWPDLLETMTACSVSGRVSTGRARAVAFDLSITPAGRPRETEPLVRVCIPVPRTNREFLFPIVEHPVFIGYRTRRYAPPFV